MTNEEDMKKIISHPKTMIGSDGLPHDPHPHPRLWGTFPRVLGHYSRKLGLFDLETAVYKMTGLTAKVFGFKDRGVLREGAIADVTIFDPEKVVDRANFKEPVKVSSGIIYVIVRGEIVMENMTPTSARPGRLISREPI